MNPELRAWCCFLIVGKKQAFNPSPTHGNGKHIREFPADSRDSMKSISLLESKSAAYRWTSKIAKV